MVNQLRPLPGAALHLLGAAVRIQFIGNLTAAVHLRPGFLHSFGGLHLLQLSVQGVPLLGHGGKPGFQLCDLRGLRLKIFQLPAKVICFGGQLIDLGLVLCVDVFQIMNHVLPVKAVERGTETLGCIHDKILPFLPRGSTFSWIIPHIFRKNNRFRRRSAKNKKIFFPAPLYKNEKDWYNTRAIDEMRQWLNG